MKTMYDVRNLLKQFGVFIYTGDRVGDLDLISDEVNELFKLNLIPITTYQATKLVIRQERRNLNRSI